MIIYFADRAMNILGSASTGLPKGLMITNDKKTEEIRKAIIAHSNRMDAKKRFARRGELQSLEDLLSFADQFSRECFSCEVKDSCKWKTEEKIDYVYFDIETKQERKKGGEQ